MKIRIKKTYVVTFDNGNSIEIVFMKAKLTQEWWGRVAVNGKLCDWTQRPPSKETALFFAEKHKGA